MTKQLNKKNDILLLTPVAGSMLFIVLYIFATLLYPGGSQIDSNSVGFSWMDNYWCNLLNEKAINGMYNPAKPVAIAAMMVLCLTMSFFWIYFPKSLKVGNHLKLAIQVSGILAMTTAFFLFTKINHDFIIDLAGFFGMIATIGTFVALYKNKSYGLFAFGVFNVFLVGVNNYFYYSKHLIIYLPVLQKISFASFLIWICSINLSLYKHTTDI